MEAHCRCVDPYFSTFSSHLINGPTISFSFMVVTVFFTRNDWLFGFARNTFSRTLTARTQISNRSRRRVGVTRGKFCSFCTYSQVSSSADYCVFVFSRLSYTVSVIDDFRISHCSVNANSNRDQCRFFEYARRWVAVRQWFYVQSSYLCGV